MTTLEIAQALETWAAANSDANSYPHEPPNYSAAFPIVAARITQDQEVVTDQQHPTQAYQQTHVQVVTVDLHLLVDPEPEWTSDQALYSLVDDLKSALKADLTLGGLDLQASPLYNVRYDGDVQREDGTRANMATMTITVGQKVKA